MIDLRRPRRAMLVTVGRSAGRAHRVNIAVNEPQQQGAARNACKSARPTKKICHFWQNPKYRHAHQHAPAKWQ